MSRKVRIEFPEAIYLVANRGNRGEAIFRDDQDRRRFLGTLGEACAKTDWQIHGYCLMNDDFHLVVRTPHANLVSGMKWFLGAYTSRFNRRHKLSGHLFAGRYRAVIVDGGGTEYLRAVCDYLHLNPVRAKLLKSSQSLREYPWSSYQYYVASRALRPSWICTAPLLTGDTVAGRSLFEARTEQRRRADDSDFTAIRHGWCFGGPSFRRELLLRMSNEIREHHYGRERRDSAEEKAMEIIRDELSRVGWSDEQLSSRPKADPIKLAAAVRLRQETTVTLKWISERLQMGAWTHLNKRLYDWRKNSGWSEAAEIATS